MTENNKGNDKTTSPTEVEAVSGIIRERIKKANQRFHANDNISAFIKPQEMDSCLMKSPVK